MKDVKVLIFCMFSLVVLSSCSSKLNISTDYSDETDFSNYQFYRWYIIEDDKKAKEKHAASGIMDNRIRTNIEEQLAAKGMSKNENGKANFFVNYSVTTVDEVDVEQYNTYSGYSRNYSWYGGGYGYGYRSGYHRGGVTMTMTGIPSEETEIQRYKKGTLIVDIIDPIEDTLVWRGAANGRLPEKKLSKKELDTAVSSIVTQLMENFPP